MTVEELIDRLREFDPRQEVIIDASSATGSIGSTLDIEDIEEEGKYVIIEVG